MVPPRRVHFLFHTGDGSSLTPVPRFGVFFFSGVWYNIYLQILYAAAGMAGLLLLLRKRTASHAMYYFAIWLWYNQPIQVFWRSDV